MVTIELPGDPSSALALLAPVGLAGILDEAGLGPAYLKWTFDEVESGREVVPSRAQVTCSAESVDVIAAAVRRHAERHLQADSWLQARIDGLSNAGKGLFSPRAGIKPDDWEGYLAQRNETLDRLGPLMTDLDWAFLAGLGEPAWWHAGDKDAQPDKGASRWEMKTRNRGEEIMVNRLHLLARAVAARTVGAMSAGLTGAALVDECGANKPDSRTPTGFTIPQPTDNVLAWLALWGLAALPVAAVSSSTHEGLSQSPGMWPRRGVHPQMAALPVVTQPYSQRAFRQLVTTGAFDLGAFGSDDDALPARTWLGSQGVVAIVRFPIRKTGSASAPERQLLSGHATRTTPNG